MLGPIVKTLQNNVEKISSFSPYFHLFLRDFHKSDVLLYLGGKLLIPFTLRNATMKTAHEAHLGQFGMKYLAQYILWPQTNGQIYHSECTKTGKNLKSLIPNSQLVNCRKHPNLRRNSTCTSLVLCILTKTQTIFSMMHRLILKSSISKNYDTYININSY